MQKMHTAFCIQFTFFKSVGNVQQSGSFVLGLLSATIIPDGGVGVGVASHLLHRHNVGTGVQQIAHEGATKIVGERFFTLASLARLRSMV